MDFLILCIFSIIVVTSVSGITVSPIYDQNTGHPQRKSHKASLNATERYRRLIPYMTYYIPSNNDFISTQNNDFGYISVSPIAAQQLAIITNNNKFQQRQQPLPGTNNKQQPTKRPNIGNAYYNAYKSNKYQTTHQPQQIQTILYNSQPPPPPPPHQESNKIYQPQIIQLSPSSSSSATSSQKIQQNVQFQQNRQIKKPIITPFLPSNQIPGDFRPMIQENHENHENQINVINLAHLQQQQQQPQLQQQQQQQPQLQQQPLHTFVVSTVRPPPQQLHLNYDTEFVTYLKPDNFVQLIKSTPAPQHASTVIFTNPKNLHQFKQQTTPAQIPTDHIIQNNYPTNFNNLNGHLYQLQNVQPPPPQPQPQIHYEIQYKQPDYTLDPDDGYGIKVPIDQFQTQQLSTKHQINASKYKTVQLVPVGDSVSNNIVTSTTPATTIYKSRHNHKVKENRPVIQTTIAPRQHLTETTQIQPPTLTTYHPSSSKIQKNYENNYKLNNNQVIKNKEALNKRPNENGFTNPTIETPTIEKQKILLISQYNAETSSPKPLLLSNNIQQNRRPHPQNIKVNTPPQPLPSSSPAPLPYRTPQHKIPVQNKLQPLSVLPEDGQLPSISSGSLSEILRKLQESNHLPYTITPDNVDNSIRTLVKILNNLKTGNAVAEIPSQHHQEDVIDYYDYNETPVKPNQDLPVGRPGPNTGIPGVDYPVFDEIPPTNFNCQEQRYKGFFGDPETNCQVWHYCDLNGGKASFLCPNGTIFSQVALTCDWWFNVKCSSTAQLYVLNERLYKYILPFNPKFPEDYSGPLVDKYLAIKFQEMEEKLQHQKSKGKSKVTKDEKVEDETTTTASDHLESLPVTNEHNQQFEIDEDGQSHNFDNAVQYEADIAENYSIDNSNDDNTLYSTPKTQQNNYINHIKNDIQYISSSSTPLPPASPSSSTPLPPKRYQSESITKSPTPISPTLSILPSENQHTNVESEKVEVIEIKSDGSTGHLIPELIGDDDENDDDDEDDEDEVQDQDRTNK